MMMWMTFEDICVLSSATSIALVAAAQVVVVVDRVACAAGRRGGVAGAAAGNGDNLGPFGHRPLQEKSSCSPKTAESKDQAGHRWAADDAAHTLRVHRPRMDNRVAVRAVGCGSIGDHPLCSESPILPIARPSSSGHGVLGRWTY